MKNRITLFICLIYILVYGQEQSSQGNFNPPESAPTVQAIFTAEAINIDGKLDEKVWEKAPLTKDFFRMEPRQGGKVKYETTVKVLYDKKNIYFGVFCKDSSGIKNIRVQDLRRDFAYGENDVFYIQLDPQNLKRFCVSFQTTPYGSQRDLQVFDDNFKDPDWDALWKVRTQITNEGYYAEFAIPFLSIRYDNTKSMPTSWGITFARLARKDYEQNVFPAIPQAFSPYRMTYAAQLKGLELPKPSLNIRVQPYSLYQWNQSSNVLNSKVQSSKLKFGGDIKWAISPQSVVDITANTDFAQADVDRAVNNLTRFNVFFPERRQFFLENSGVFAGADVDGIKPFFSRTIGLANSQSNADPVPIEIGARYTNRNKSRTIASLYVRQKATENQAATNFGVLRFLKNYGEQNSVGMMLTQRVDESDQLKNSAQNNNTTITIDGFLRPTNTWQIQYLGSSSRENSNDSIGYAANLFIGWSPQNAYVGWVSKYVDKKYQPGMGFVFANNTIQHNPGGYFIWRPKGFLGKIIRRWDPGIFVDYYQNANNFKFQSARMDIFPVFIIFQDNALLDVTYHPTWENFFFSPLGIDVKPDNYFFNRLEVKYRTDASKKISGEVGCIVGPYYDGKLNTYNALLRIAPSAKFSLTGEIETNEIRNLGINKTNQNISLYTAGIRIAANPRLQLSSFYQYNNFDKRSRWNSRVSWEFAPLSFIFLVFNDNEIQNTNVRSQNAISKITFLKQF